MSSHPDQLSYRPGWKTQCLGAEKLGEGATNVGRLLIALRGGGRTVGEGLGGVGYLVGAAAADHAGLLRFGEVGLHQARKLGEAAQADYGGCALEGMGFGAHRLEIACLGRQASGDHITAATRLLGEGVRSSASEAAFSLIRRPLP